MALRVPTVSGETVAERPLDGGFQRSSVSPGMLQDNKLGDAGKVLQEVGAQIQERQDADELMRAETEIKSKYLEWEGQAKQRRGQQAWGVAKEAGELVDKESERITGGLSSPRAKQLFARETMKLRGQAVGTFSGHEMAQRRESLDESAQASIVGSINLAAANPANIELITATKADIIKRNAMRAQVNGWSPEMAEAKQTEYLTNLHKQVIQGLVRDQPEAAQAYFEANKAEIEGSQHAEVGAFAAKATATRLGESAADAVWQQLGPKGDRDAVQLDKLEESIRKSPLGDEAKKTAIAAVKERAAAFKDARKERDETLEAKVNLSVMNGSGARQIRSMPEFMQMDGEKQRRIMDFIENRAVRGEQIAAARESRAASAETRAQTRLSREGMGAYLIYSSPDTLAGMTENQVLNLLPSLGNELTSHLMQQKRELAKNPQKLAEARMDDDDFKQVAQEMGLRPFAAKSEDEKASLGGLKFRVEQMISNAQQGGKKMLSRTEKLELMRSEMARTVTVDTWGWNNKEVPVVALTPEQVKSVIIPPKDRQAIAQSMQKMAAEFPNDPRFAPNEDNLRRWYLRSKSPAANMIPNGR